ncbi:uncharacterized protein AC631_03853 [Debaryomyces fabryi]|uniref:RING-type domain-containing protein n=1 Tax=Debaryomyces fabryi TaxID=58627 RepID=A0A0V1PVT7_9ASCO|nr:uncharacterized protein AC631_03853 [Debaryomyces fabryi]KSA00381.1 hypothetical protein AC631_03853 [Debaryomyces fabryi]CUM52341.1 unnamed protein product [Debaryomyces fabryi]
MSTANIENIINLSSEDEDDVEIIAFKKETQDLIDNPIQPPHTNSTKKLSNVQCPICFDEVTNATATSCGHVFCLECIQQSIASSTARGQTKGKKGVGLCPLCRKRVTFKETMLLRMKLAKVTGPPPIPSEFSGSKEP